MSREVILLGKGDLAIQIGEWFLTSTDYHLTAVVPTFPAPAWSASLPDWARAHGVPVVESGHYRDLPGMKDPAWRPALAFSVYYDRIVKRDFIDRCERILNLHNGPLPRYRGVSPINWALKNGEQHHGVTIHEITPGIDDGPIISQVTFPIYPEFDEVKDVYRRALRFGWLLFQETIPLLESVTPRPQDPTQALYYNTSQNALLGDRRSFTRSQSLHTEASGSH